MEILNTEYFLSSLTKYLQQLCQDSIGFDRHALVSGHLFLSVDDREDIELYVNETVYNAENNSVRFLSNSCHLTQTQDDQIKNLLVKLKEQTTAESTTVVEQADKQGLTDSIKHEKSSKNVLAHDSELDASDQDLQEFKHQPIKNTPSPPVKPKRQRRSKAKHTYTCELCSRSFQAPAKLAAHLKSHVGERPFTCETCGKNFVSELSLKSHMIVHTEQKPYMCDVCGRSYKQPQSLVLHKRQHTGEKPHVCQICGIAFAQLSSLQYHKESHVMIREFQCDVCRRAFKTLRHLKRHKKTHSEEKRFSCAICGKRFLNKEYLKKHSWHHSSEKPHICDLCGERFARADYLAVHKRKHLVGSCLSSAFLAKTF